jgi:hypothetical protein
MPEDEILAMFRTRASVNQETAIRQLFYDGHGTDYLAEAQALRDRELPVRLCKLAGMRSMIRMITCACTGQS